jgi:hypothetical protein
MNGREKRNEKKDRRVRGEVEKKRRERRRKKNAYKFLEFLLCFGNRIVADIGHRRHVVRAFGCRHLRFQRLELLLRVLELIQAAPLLLESQLEGLEVFLDLGQLSVAGLQPLLACLK